jgi:chitin synthase
MDKRPSSLGSTPDPEASSSSGADRGRRNKKYVNLYFCIKYKNSGKLSSHNWFFNGFCNELKPKYAVLLDVGLRPYP